MAMEKTEHGNRAKRPQRATTPTNADDGKVRWATFEQGKWSFCLAATSDGICYADTHPDGEAALARWVAGRYPGHALVRDDVALRAYAEQLRQFWLGRSIRFETALDLRGTPFQRDVWQALLAIPFGETRSYSDIAQAIGRPSAVRAVGAAIGANPVLVMVPCHRVVGKNGALTGFRGGLPLKEELLGLEGRRD